MSNIKRPRFGGKLQPQTLLADLAECDGLKSVIVICEWEDGTVTTPWSATTMAGLAFGAKVLDMNISEEINEAGEVD